MKSPGINSKKRLFAVLCFCAFIFLALIVRLFIIQIVQGEQLQEKALSQWTRDTALSALRGRIVDREGTVLAQSGTAYKVLLWPQVIAKASPTERNRIASELAKILDLDEGSVLQKVSDVTKQEIVLKRQVERETVDKISALKLGNGVVIAVDTKRYYPSGRLFSQLIGFTTIDGVGQEGLERTFDKYLAGKNGRMITETDRKGNTLAYGVQEYIEPLDGFDLVLTVDKVVQSFLVKALEEAYTVNRAVSAQGILMNCKTGEIIAIASIPDYDPNAPPRDDLDLLRELVKNRVVTDAYEPGSTFKVVTLSSALDSGNAGKHTSVYCPGYRIIAGAKVKCWRSGGHGQQDLAKAVQNSCNPGFMDMALRMGTDSFYDYIYAFGFGSTTGSGLTGESRGIVTHEKYIREADLARIGFGQSIAVTPVQLATAVCAAVNGGNLMQPYIIDRILSRSGEVILENKPTPIRRVIKPETSSMVRELLEGVVVEGSGRNAAIPGYRVGGKTGTAQKYVNGKPSSSALVASFIGFAPADDPELVLLIIVDEPQVGVVFGSTVAAPFFKKVMEQTLRHYGFTPEELPQTVTVPDVTGITVAQAKNKLYNAGLEAVYQAEDTVIAQIPKAGDQVQKGTEVLLYTELTAPDPEAEETVMVTVPDVSDMTRLEANDALKELGLVIVFDPPDRYGKAVSQAPRAGSKVPYGSQVRVEFSRID